MRGSYFIFLTPILPSPPPGRGGLHRMFPSSAITSVHLPAKTDPPSQPRVLDQSRMRWQSPQAQSRPRPAGRRPKLRLSCDACAAAKVKCGKERPRCERCVAGDLDCVYGPSLKHGKPERKKSLLDSHTSANREIHSNNPLNQQQQQSMNSSNLQNCFLDLQQSFADLVQDIGGNTDIGIDLDQQWLSNPEGGITTTSPALFSFGAVEGTFASPESAARNPGSTAVTPPSNSRPNHNFSSLGNWSSPSLSSNVSGFPTHDLTSSINPPSSSLLPESASTDEPLPLPQDIHGSASSHDCYTIANVTLASLHFRSSSASTHDSPTDGSARPVTASSSDSSIRGPQVQTFDDVLKTNQQAITNVCQLLKCPCANDPNMAMLYGSIIVKVLFWHRVAARSAETLSPPPSWNTSFPSLTIATSPSSIGVLAGKNPNSNCSRPNPAAYNNHITASMIVPEPVRIGKYIPDDEAQEPMRRVLLLSNLKKAGRMIETLTRIAESCLDAGVGNLYSMLGMWLRAELSRTIKEVSNGAKGAWNLSTVES